MTSPVFADLDTLERAANSRLAVAFVWPDEGAFDPETGEWKFNADHSKGGKYADEDFDGAFEPLIVDIVTANAVLTLYRALAKPSNQDSVRASVAKGRGDFAHLVKIAFQATKRVA